MNICIVVNNPKNWKLDIPGVEVVSAKSFLTEEKYSNTRGMKVFNLCRTYKYQSLGYYVSLIAVARGHKVIPRIQTILDMKSPTIVKIVTEDLEDLLDKAFAKLNSKKYTLSIYFGRNVSKHYDKLSLQIFNLFQAPFIRAYFVKNSDDEWQVQNVTPIPASEIPDEHMPYVIEFAKEYFSERNFSVPKRNVNPYDMAILVSEDEGEPPSNEKALEKFEKAARENGFNVEYVEKDDYNKIAEFDALFIRATTRVNDFTFRFAQRADAEGLVVIDDPTSIIRCSNKVYLAELMLRQKIPAPKTLIVSDTSNALEVAEELKYPMIIKQPDSAFSLGVVKVSNEQEYIETAERLLDESELILAQEFLPTEFDWRVGIIDREPLYVCKYFMARKHWQIMNWEKEGTERYGKYETIAWEMVPRKLINTALKAANLIGDGFYGVDLKQIGNEFYVIEINDNPSIDAGVEDKVIKDKLYERIMETFLERVLIKKEVKPKK